MIRRPLEGLQTIGEVLGDALDLPWLKAGVTRVRERFESDRKEATGVNREFLDWLAHRPQPERPYFAFLNYFDAHSPYQLSPRRVHRFGVKPTEEARVPADPGLVDRGQEAGFVRGPGVRLQRV